MPYSAPTPCRVPNCKELVTDKSARGLCVRHVREACAYGRNTTTRRGKMSDEEYKRDAWYSTKTWIRLRRAYISRNPLCVSCKHNGIVRGGDVVDHKVERKDDDSLRLKWSNLQTLCHACHNEKTRFEKRKRNQQTTNKVENDFWCGQNF